MAALLAGAGTSLLTPAGELTSEARSLLADIDPATFAALVGTAMTVPESVTDTLGTILAVVDPNGLGQFQEDRSALSVAAVVLAAAIGRDPVELGKLAVAGEIDPRFAEVTGFILDLTTRVTPQLIDRINNLVGILGPYTLEALAGAFALLEDPEVGALLEEAFANPLTVVVSFGSAVMAIPGLAQLVAPGTFDDPRATYGAILGLAVLAILVAAGLASNTSATHEATSSFAPSVSLPAGLPLATLATDQPSAAESRAAFTGERLDAFARLVPKTLKDWFAAP